MDEVAEYNFWVEIGHVRLLLNAVYFRLKDATDAKEIEILRLDGQKLVRRLRTIVDEYKSRGIQGL